MLGKRIAKVTTAVVLTGLLGIAGVALTVDAFSVDESGRRAALARHLRQESAVAWPGMAEAYRRTVPPASIGLPAGDPRPVLVRLRRIPHAGYAFHVSPRRVLTLAHRPAKAGAGALETITVDLDTWQPRLLDRYRPGRGKRGLSTAQKRQWLDEAVIKPVSDRVADAWDWQELEEGWRKYPVLPSSDEDPLYLKGDAASGFIGVRISAFNLMTSDGDAILERLGLAHKFFFAACCWGNSGADFAPPAGHAFLEPMRLKTREAYEASLLPEMELRFWGLVAAIACGLVFTVSASIRQFATLLQEGRLAHAQSNFVSGISHEMRLPLTTVKMYAEMLEQGVITDPDKRLAYLRTIGREADRLGRLIENVLEFSRISNRRKTYSFERLQVAEIVGDALEALEYPLEQAGVTVEAAVPQSLEVRGDRDALVQSLVNLLSNALKYASGDKIVRLSATEGPGEITLSVQDYGPGIPEREQARIFRPFYRIGDELTRAAPGSGLGLTLVKEYAAAHGGRVELHSKPGQGARFDIILPKAGPAGA